MKVLLINPPWQRREQDVRKKLKIGSCLPSLGLDYIAAVLRKNDIDVEIFYPLAVGIDLENSSKHLANLDYRPVRCI